MASAGELNYFYNSSTGVTTLQGDTNGDEVADFAIDLTGNVTINAADLIGIIVGPVVIEVGWIDQPDAGWKQLLSLQCTASGPQLKYGGSAVTTGQFGGWSLIGAEQTASGYEVAWKFAGSNQYSIWNTDSNGNYTSGFGLSGASADLMSLEPSFHQDLNGDGVIGLVANIIEALGVDQSDGGWKQLLSLQCRRGPAAEIWWLSCDNRAIWRLVVGRRGTDGERL